MFWQTQVKNIISGGLKSGTNDDEILASLERNRLGMSYRQFCIYKKKVVLKLKNGG